MIKFLGGRTITLIVSALSLLVYLLCIVFGIDAVMEYLHFPTYRDSGSYFQLWRYITPALIHFSELHIGFNLIWWWILAGIVERFCGWREILKVFLISSLLSNIAQYIVVDEKFGGLSGVVYGLFGYVWIFSKFDPKQGMTMPNAIMIQVVAWLVLGFTGLLDGLIGPMANMAHLVGLTVGLLLALSALKRAH